MIDDSYDDQSKKFFVSKLIGDEKQCQRDKFGQVQPLPHLQLPYLTPRFGTMSHGNQRVCV